MMAIHPLFPGIEVTVEVDNIALREYEDSSDNGANSDTTIIRYVESQSGKQFAIVLSYEHGCEELMNSDIEAVVNVDGQVIRRPCFAKTYRPSRNVFDGVRNMKDGSWVEQKFLFASVNIGTSYSITTTKMRLT